MSSYIFNTLSEVVDLSNISEDELNEALEEVGRYLVYNYFIYKEDVTYKTFLESLDAILNLVRK